MCIFCKIVSGELPSYKVYEDDKVLAFLNIEPVSIGHILVIPKKHVVSLEETSPEDLTAVMLVVQKIGGTLKKKLGVDGYNVGENNGSAAGQTIPHLHFHLIPRHENDGLPSWPKMENVSDNLEEIAKKLTA